MREEDALDMSGEVSTPEVRAARWIGPLTGLSGAVVTMVGLILSDYGNAFDGAVNPTTSPELAARLIAEEAPRLEAGATLAMVGLFLLVWFFPYLHDAARIGGASRWLASVSTAGGLITVTLMALGEAWVLASTQTAFTGDSAVIPKTFVVLDWGYWRIFAPFISAHLLAVGIVIVRVRLVPRLVGWVGITLAFMPLILPEGMMTAVFAMWVAALSVALLVTHLRSPDLRPR